MTFAITFPGQGSQAVGMLAGLLAEHDSVKETFAEASEALGYDLAELVINGPAEELNKTWRTQPALLTASVAIWRLWQQQGGAQPSVMAGHSLGEYSALVCAGVLTLSDAVKLVELRGELMQEAVPEGTGAMSAIIGLDNDTIIANCAKAQVDENDVVSAANFNSPGQVVIAGTKAAVERANVLMKESGAKRALPLPVSVPSHCALMRSAAEHLERTLADMVFNEPNVPVINNVDVKQETSAAAIKDALVRQLYYSVRWSETVEAMVGLGVTLSLEMGPGKVLSGLAKRIDKRVEGLAVNDDATLQQALAAVQA
ncbi:MULTISPECIES: ACP S-malonyltransferase [Oceanisphaera]|uniref:Malonyl CoA-acyl carrier protein transacylase n=1 Tax=Oceanisphaera ostreae TaxID=914151 RepID=A0ABW3KPV3_9GAMM